MVVTSSMNVKRLHESSAAGPEKTRPSDAQRAPARYTYDQAAMRPCQLGDFHARYEVFSVPCMKVNHKTSKGGVVVVTPPRKRLRRALSSCLLESFWEGAGRVLDIGATSGKQGRHGASPYSIDAEALASDWRAVGDDLLTAALHYGATKKT
jgi:hypothetical protein